MSKAEEKDPEESPEVTEKAPRRRFTLAYKEKILAEADQCTGSGELGALLRREAGLGNAGPESTWPQAEAEQA